MRFVDGGVVADQHDAGGFALDFLDRCLVAVDEDDSGVTVFGGGLLADDDDVAFIKYRLHGRATDLQGEKIARAGDGFFTAHIRHKACSRLRLLHRVNRREQSGARRGV